MKFQIEKPNNNSCSCGTSDEAETECPHCKEKGIKVKGITVKSQLKKEFYSELENSYEDFNFCTNPDCDTVYYSNDKKETFNQSQIKSKVTSKNDDPKTPLCYCKKLLKENVLEMIENGEEDIAGKIKKIVSEGKTFCEKANPRGTCCTEDIATFLQEHNVPTNSSSCSTSNSGCC